MSRKSSGSLLAGAGAGLLISAAAGLLLAPQDGRTSRTKTAGSARKVKESPSAAAQRCRERKEKCRQSGQVRYELICSEMEILKKQARLAAEREATPNQEK
ncbi:YtxH domain-containing protein [Alteribacillus sp. HJP-4]|uniref:YtxH domain-containing protein n=1 Tax=Alteribacillus sp. HJP-4 TaxID=2775394 RepID=UPI0035CCE2C6